MKSNILKKDQDDLIRMTKLMSPQKRLMAFYHHSRLIARLALAGKKAREKSKHENK